MLQDDVFHGGICEDEGNVTVHGGIFDSASIEITDRFSYPNSTSLKFFIEGTMTFITNEKLYV